MLRERARPRSSKLRRVLQYTRALRRTTGLFAARRSAFSVRVLAASVQSQQSDIRMFYQRDKSETRVAHSSDTQTQVLPYRSRSTCTQEGLLTMSIRWSRARLRTAHRQVEHAPFLSLRALLQTVEIAWAAFELWRAAACSSTLVEGQAAQARPRPCQAQPPQRPRKSLHRRWLSYRRAAQQRQRLEG